MKMNDERFCKHFIWDHTLVNVYSSWPGWFCLIKEITWDKKVLRTIVRFFTVHNKPRDEGGFLVSIKLNIFSLWPIIYLTAGHLFWQEKMYLFNIKRPMNFNFPLLPYYITWEFLVKRRKWWFFYVLGFLLASMISVSIIWSAYWNKLLYLNTCRFFINKFQ